MKASFVSIFLGSAMLVVVPPALASNRIGDIFPIFDTVIYLFSISQLVVSCLLIIATLIIVPSTLFGDDIWKEWGKHARSLLSLLLMTCLLQSGAGLVSESFSNVLILGLWMNLANFFAILLSTPLFWIGDRSNRKEEAIFDAKQKALFDKHFKESP